MKNTNNKLSLVIMGHSLSIYVVSSVSFQVISIVHVRSFVYTWVVGEKKGKGDEHQSYLMVIDEEDNNTGQMRMMTKKKEMG